MRQNLGFLPRAGTFIEYVLWCVVFKNNFFRKKTCSLSFLSYLTCKIFSTENYVHWLSKTAFFSFKKNCRISLQAIQVRRFDSGVWPTFFSFFSKNMNIVLIILKNGTTMHYGHRYIFVRKKVFLRLAKLPKNQKLILTRKWRKNDQISFFQVLKRA